MKYRITIASLVITLALACGNAVGAEKIDHLAQASEHINTATAQGQTGSLPALVQHAQTALDHVRMAQAQQQKPNPDLDKAAQTLQEAIQEGQGGSAKKALEHTRESVEYIDAAKGALGG